MLLLLDTRFERNNSQLRILDQDTRLEIISWDKSTIEKALDSGLICPEDFKQPLSDKECIN